MHKKKELQLVAILAAGHAILTIAKETPIYSFVSCVASFFLALTS
jgi:hypothetical protein